MPARAYWQGQIRLALVSIPVEIYPATRSGAAISFRQIHEPSGRPVKYEKVVPGIGAIDHDDIVKGYELSKGNYVLLDEDEIEAVRLESKRTLELVLFVENDAIDILYYSKPYYVVPADELAEEAYVVLREALKRSRMTGVGQLSVRGQEQLVALQTRLWRIARTFLDPEIQTGKATLKDVEDVFVNKLGVSPAMAKLEGEIA